MKKLLLIVVALLILTESSHARRKNKIKAFEISFPQITVANSIYDQLEFLDCRNYIEDLGSINGSLIMEETSLAIQFDSLLKSIVKETGQGKTLLVQLRNLHFSEINKTGHCHIRMSLFEKNNSDYYFLNTMDTLIHLKAGKLTAKMMDAAGVVSSNFIIDNLQALSKEEEPYMLTDIRNIDYYEKNNLRLYSTDKYKDGIYYTFRSFASQVPDEINFTAGYHKNGLLKELKYTEDSTKSKKVRPQDIYAVIVKGQPYVASDKTYIPVYKENDEFKFINDGTVKIDYGSYAAGTIAANILTGALFGMIYIPVPKGVPEKVVMAIDHLNGSFIRVPASTEP